MLGLMQYAPATRTASIFLLLCCTATYSANICHSALVNVRDDHLDKEWADSAHGSNVDIEVTGESNEVRAAVWSTFATNNSWSGAPIYFPRWSPGAYGYMDLTSGAAPYSFFTSPGPAYASAIHSFSETFVLERTGVVTILAGGEISVGNSPDFGFASASASVSVPGVAKTFSSSMAVFDEETQSRYYYDEVEKHMILPKGTYTFGYSANTSARGKRDHGAGANVRAWGGMFVDEYLGGAGWSGSFRASAYDDQDRIDAEGYADRVDVPDEATQFDASYKFAVDEKKGAVELKVDGEMSGKFRNGKWNVGGKYDLQVKAGQGTTVSEIRATSTAYDKLYITSNAEVVIPAGPLKLHGYFDGNYIGSLLNDTQSVDLKVRIGSNLNGYASFQYTAQYNGEPNFIAPQYQEFLLNVPFEPNGSSFINLNLDLDGKFKLKSGILGITMDVGRTVVIDGITFADGTTPESHGYQIHLASGLPSPNAAIVPEPSTLALFAIGCAVIGYRRRRA